MDQCGHLWFPYGSLFPCTSGVQSRANDVVLDTSAGSWGFLGLLGPPGAALTGPPGTCYGHLGPPGASWGLQGPLGASCRLPGPCGTWGILGSPGHIVLGRWRLAWFFAPQQRPQVSWGLLGPLGASRRLRPLWLSKRFPGPPWASLRLLQPGALRFWGPVVSDNQLPQGPKNPGKPIKNTVWFGT